jgi:mevalonate kinase
MITTHLFGEHVIVYSMKAIAFATNILITATVA